LDYEFKGTMGSVGVSLFKALPRLNLNFVNFLKITFKRDFMSEICKTLNFCKMQECYFACKSIKKCIHVCLICLITRYNRDTYLPLGVGLGSGLMGVVSPRQLEQSHSPVGRDLSPTQNVW